MIGKFFVVEGIDGSGKSTLCKNIVNYYLEKRISFVHHFEPTNLESGKRIRSFLKGNLELTAKEQIELFLDDRENSIQTNVLPNLKKGVHVLLDRYMYSTAAYQASEEFSSEKIIEMNLSRGFLVPDQVFYLSISPELALERIERRSTVKERFDSLEKLKRIQAEYKKILPKQKTIYIDAEEDENRILQECLVHFNQLLVLS